MELDVIDLLSAVALLRTRVPDLAEDVAQKIAQELGRLPLALEQAAAYLDKTAMPGRDYLDLLRRRAADLFARGQVSGRHETIATLWDITLERISTEDPAAVVLLELCAYLAPEPIPLDLFSSHADLLPEPLTSAAADPLAFNEVIGILVDYSLAGRTQAGLQVHRLVQAVIRARSAYTSRSSPAQGCLMTAEGPAERGSAGRLGVVLGLLRADAPEQITRTPEAWPRRAVLLPHVLAAVSHFDDLSRPGRGAAEADASWLLDRAAMYLHAHVRLSEARPLAERSLAISEAAYGPDHPEVATLRANPAAIVGERGPRSDDERDPSHQ